MIVITIVFAVIVLPILWVIIVPVNMRVNSETGLYEIRQVGTIAMSLHPGETPFVRMRVLGFSIDMQRKEEHNKVQTKKVKTGRTKPVKSAGAWIDLFKGIVKSIRCRRFICNIDFDDVVLNAQLFPVGYFISRGPVIFNVNFEKKYLLDVWIQARIYQMVWTMIRFYSTK